MRILCYDYSIEIFSPGDIYLYIFICLFISSQINIFRILTAQIGIIDTADSTQSKPQAKENHYHEEFCDPVFPLCETRKRMYQDITHDLYIHHFKSSYRFDLSIVPWLEKEHILIKPMQVMHARSFSCVRLFATLWTVAHQAPLSMGFSRREYWSGLPVPSPM